jgi:dTDP-4-amino-4,6-dideoxygalactose transaminase
MNTEPKRTISFSPPDMSELEINEVADCLRSGWITTGPRTKKLEKVLKEYVGANGLVCLNSATASEELSLRILGIGEGDEVIVPAYTYTSSAAAAIHVGAEVKFVDCQGYVDGKGVLEMDYDKVADAITEKTKAIIPVDLGGVPCDYDRIFEIVEEKRNLFKPKNTTTNYTTELDNLGARIQERVGRVLVVADGAHALGAEWKGKKVGSIADFTSFSFHAVKNFTTAEGGAASWRHIDGIDDEEIYHWFQLLSLHGQSKDALAKTKLGAWEYDIVAPLYKCNMTDIMAAIGLKQLERYPGLLARRKEIIKRYDGICDELGVDHIIHFTDEYQSSGHLYITRITGCGDEQRRTIITRMAEKGVATNVHYKPLPMMTAYKALGNKIEDYPNAYKLFENEVTLPLHTKLSDEDVDYVIDVFRETVKEVRGY